MNTRTKTAQSAAIRGAVIIALLIPLAACVPARGATGEPGSPVPPPRQYEWQIAYEPPPRQYEWQITHDADSTSPD